MARRYRRRADLDSPIWWAGILVVLAFYLVVAVLWVLGFGLWLAWALIALPVTGIAKLAHKGDLAQDMIGSLRWTILFGSLVREP